jgi:WhiB family redox-sensing transcriptional regulator
LSEPRAKCEEAPDPEIFFPKSSDAKAEDAKWYCHRCPIREKCLIEALENGLDYGVWGGLNEKERRTIKRRARYQRERRAA